MRRSCSIVCSSVMFWDGFVWHTKLLICFDTGFLVPTDISRASSCGSFCDGNFAFVAAKIDEKYGNLSTKSTIMIRIPDFLLWRCLVFGLVLVVILTDGPDERRSVV